MPWSAGVYTRGYSSWTADANSGLPISATKFDTEDNDFAAGLNNCLTKDGLSGPTGALTWTQPLTLAPTGATPLTLSPGAGQTGLSISAGSSVSAGMTVATAGTVPALSVTSANGVQTTALQMAQSGYTTWRLQTPAGGDFPGLYNVTDAKYAWQANPSGQVAINGATLGGSGLSVNGPNATSPMVTIAGQYTSAGVVGIQLSSQASGSYLFNAVGNQFTNVGVGSGTSTLGSANSPGAATPAGWLRIQVNSATQWMPYF